jgi:hypothetical protein
LFPEETKVEELKGTTELIVSKDSLAVTGLSDLESSQLDSSITSFHIANQYVLDRLGTYKYEAANIGASDIIAHVEISYIQGNQMVLETGDYLLDSGMSNFSLVYVKSPSNGNIYYTAINPQDYYMVPNNFAEGSFSECYDVIREKIHEFINNAKGRIEANIAGTNSPLVTLTINEPSLNGKAFFMTEAMRKKLSYNFRGEILYDTPENIKNRLIARFGDSKYYFPLYTRTIIQDKHPTPDDGFTFEIASDMSDGIKWLAQNKNLLVGTETAEWVIPAGTHATNIQAILNSRYGSDRIQATSIGDAMCFFQSGKKALVEYYIPQQDNNFRANNMAMLSPNMLHESPAFDFDFISAPYTKIFVSREDGTMVCLLYERSTGTFAWGRITTGKEVVVDGVKTRTGLIKSVATVPGQSGYDDVFLIVERGGAYFLEMLAERRRSDHDEAEVFLDSYRRWEGNPEGYTPEAVVYDETGNKTYPLSQGPISGHVMWVGYPYTSRVRSMPVLANNQMKPNVIKNLLIRFNDSFMPRVGSVSMDNGRERAGQVDSIPRPEPYSGVIQIPFPGVWDRDVFFELIHDKPTRCRVLAVNAEAN